MHRQKTQSYTKPREANYQQKSKGDSQHWFKRFTIEFMQERRLEWDMPLPHLIFSNNQGMLDYMIMID